MKHLASKEKPKESGWYLWWDEPEDEHPFHVLAVVKSDGASITVNFNWDTNISDWTFIDDVADRLWLKVA